MVTISWLTLWSNRSLADEASKKLLGQEQGETEIGMKAKS